MRGMSHHFYGICIQTDMCMVSNSRVLYETENMTGKENYIRQ